MRKCPKCSKSDGLRKIIYGLPALPLDENKYFIGGCIISPNKTEPTHRCVSCDWEGDFKRNYTIKSRIEDFTCIKCKEKGTYLFNDNSKNKEIYGATLEFRRRKKLIDNNACCRNCGYKLSITYPNLY